MRFLSLIRGGETYKRKLFDFVEPGHFIQLREGTDVKNVRAA